MEHIIYNELEDAIYDIVLKHQDKIGITSGDEYIDFGLTIQLLAEQIFHTLVYQAYSNGVEDNLEDDFDMLHCFGEDLRMEDVIRQHVEAS